MRTNEEGSKKREKIESKCGMIICLVISRFVVDGSKRREKIESKCGMILCPVISRVVVNKAKDMRVREVDLLISLSMMTVIPTRHNSKGIQMMLRSEECIRTTLL
jgi:hypothetical protein